MCTVEFDLCVESCGRRNVVELEGIVARAASAAGQSQAVAASLELRAAGPEADLEHLEAGVLSLTIAEYSSTAL